MKWCTEHWNALRAAIEVRGLSKFGAQNSEELHADIVGQLEGEQTQFDPLMGSFWRINNVMMENVGLRMMGHCPLCILVEDGRPELVANWVDGVTNEALAYAHKAGLVKSQ